MFRVDDNEGYLRGNRLHRRTKGVPFIRIIDSIFHPFYRSEHRTVRIPIYGQPPFFHRFRSSFSSARKAHHSPSGHRGEEALRPGNISRNFCVVTREFCIAFDPPQAGRKGSFFHAVTIRVSGAVFAIDVTRCSNLDPTNRSRSRCH